MIKDILDKYEERVLKTSKAWMEHRITFDEMSNTLTEAKALYSSQLYQELEAVINTAVGNLHLGSIGDDVLDEIHKNLKKACGVE